MSSAFRSVLSPHVERSSTTAWLALGDALVIAGFLAMGALSHGFSPVTHPLRVASTIAPFLLGWAIAAPLVGAYAPRARQSVGRAVAFAGVAWLFADLIGSGLRATPYFHGNAPMTFVAVTFGVGAVSLALWRGAVAWFLGR